MSSFTTSPLDLGLQFLRPVQPSPGWLQNLPSGTQPKALFYPSALSTPTSSDEEDAGEPHVSEGGGGVRGANGQLRVPGIPVAPKENVIAAAVFMNRFFAAKLFAPFAVAGGFAMWLRGSGRVTDDVDICVGGSVRALYAIILMEERFLLPSSSLPGAAMRMYVKTGPSFGDPGFSSADGDDEDLGVTFDGIETQCGQDHLVKVELLLSGLRPKDFEQHVVDESLTVGKQHFRVKTLSPICLLKNKIGTYLNRTALKDYQDITFLLGRYKDLYEARRDQLDPEETETFLEQIMESPLGPQGQKDWMKAVLLGKAEVNKPPSSAVGL